MTIRTRRFIYISFILTFLLIAPLLVLYTAGYRWNNYHNRLQKIGSLVIRTMPRTVTINVADMHVTKTTPWRYNELLPNEYVITITKDGYDTWQKKMTIYQGETTFAEHVYLFKNHSQPQIMSNTIIDYWTYQDKQNSSVFIANNTLQLLNHRTGNQEQLVEFTQPIVDSLWSDDQNTLLLKTSGGWQIWSNAHRNALTNVNQNFKSSNNCKFRPGENNAIYCQDPSAVYEHHLITNDTKTLVTVTSTEKIVDFLLTDKLYYLSQNDMDSNVYLKIQDPFSQSYPDFLLPSSSGYHIIHADYNSISILDEQNHILYLLNLSNEETSFNRSSRIINDVSDVLFNDRGDILYYNDWEVWIYRNNETQLITRQSQTIIQAFWYPSYNHIGVLSENGIKLIELDRRDQQNSTTVTTWEDIKKASLDKEAEHIYFLSSEGNLFNLSILDKDVGFERPNWRQ